MKVKKNTAPINSIVHSITFATAEEINNLMLNRYEQYDYLYEELDDNDHLTEQIHCMQNIADAYGEEANRRYADALLEYEPLWNVDYTEDGENHNRGTGSGSGSSTQTPSNWKVVNNGGATNTHSDAGYNNLTDSDGRIVTLTVTSSDGNSHNDTTEQQGTFTTSGSNTANTTDDGSHHIRKTGNYGVTSSQDLLTQQFETETLRNVMDWYLSKFAVCFDLRIEGVDGLW